MNKYILVSVFLVFGIIMCLNGQTVNPVKLTALDKTLNSQWSGKKVAFLGDSMTDKKRVGTTCVYWEYLEELLGIEPVVYGIGGNEWTGIYNQAQKLFSEHASDVDAILIFAGTNDYNHSVPLGSFFSETERSTNHNGQNVVRKYRMPVFTDTTFSGRINKVLSFLKTSFPDQQIILLTPIHRGFAQFAAANVQPDENFANARGLYIEDYVESLKQAAGYWSVPIIDLYTLSGLYPLSDAFAKYFNNADTDKLHPNALGDYRLAKTIQYQLLAFPSDFKINK